MLRDTMTPPSPAGAILDPPGGIRGWLRKVSDRVKAAVIAYNDRLTLEAIGDAYDAGRQTMAGEISELIRSVAPRGHGGCEDPGCGVCALADQAGRLAQLASLAGTPEARQTGPGR